MNSGCRLPHVLVAGLLSAAFCSGVASDLASQQVLEVDIDAGRELAGGVEYLFSNGVVDYDRRLVLVVEAADPLAVTAYSLDGGAVQGVFGGGQPGDGPGELTQLYATAVGPEGIFVSGPRRVLYWSWSGTLLHQWAPTAPSTNELCSFKGRPAVTLQKGLVYRGDDGESVAVGGEARLWLDQSAAPGDAFRMVRLTLMTCSDSAAYVLDGYNHVLTEYKTGVEPRLVAMPAELVEAARERLAQSSENHYYPGYNKIFLADDGRLVMTTAADGLAGAVVDPQTGRYALLKQKRLSGGQSYVGMFGDSIVTLESSREPARTRMVDGRDVRVFYGDKTHIFVRPRRRTEGEPCM